MIQTIVLKIDKTKFQCEIIDNQTFYIRRLRRNGSWTFGFSPSEINEGVWMPELAKKSFNWVRFSVVIFLTFRID